MKTALRLALVLLATLALAAPAAAAPPSVIFFMPIGSADTPFILMAEKGILAAAGLHPEIPVARVYPYNTNSISTYIEFTARQGHDYIVGVGGYYADAIAKVAPGLPKTRFVVIDGKLDLPNVKSITFDDFEGGFLAGLSAGVVTATRKVGFLGATTAVPAIAEFERGFKEGVEKANPGCKVVTDYLGKTVAAFDDRKAAYDHADRLYRGGCDVLFPAAGSAAFGAIDAARDRQKFVIGVDADQDARAIGRVLTSVVKRIDSAILNVIGDIATDRFTAAPLQYNTANDGVALTAFAYSSNAIGREKLARIRDLVFELKRRHGDALANQIRLGTAANAAAADKAPADAKPAEGKQPKTAKTRLHRR